MNPIEKPKHVKLWKNSPGFEKKQKFKKNKSTPDQKGKFRKEKYKGTGDKHKTNLDFQQNDANTDLHSILKNPSKKEKGNQENRGDLHKQQSNKRKNEDSQDSTPNKKVKQSNKTKKEWKRLRMQKKSQEDKFDVGNKLKNLWEELRREDCKPEKKSQLLKQVCELIKGRVKEFTFAHDTVRVLECVFASGAETHRSLLFEELKSEIVPLAKSKYGKFFLIKMLKYGTRPHKDAIMKAFHGKVISLIRHGESSEVLEFAFNEVANSTQRFEFVQEFYGPDYKFFKVAEFHSLNEILEKHPEKTSSVIKNMKENILRLLDKSVVRHSIVHHAIWQFMTHSDPASRTEMIEALREIIPQILHTRDGYKVAMHCIWHGTQKDRKAIIKSMKGLVTKIAKEEHGHMVLLAIFDSVDDTKILQKKIIRELNTNLLELSKDVHGKKVLIYLLNPRDPHFIHPDVINILKGGDSNEISKKDPTLRRSELKSAVAETLLQLIRNNISTLYRDNAFCLFTVTILKLTVGNRMDTFKSIAELAKEPYTSENKNTHVIEHKGSSFMLKQLIVHDKDEQAGDCTFSEVLVNTVPPGIMKSWTECNRGAFLLVSLVETELSSVVERVKEELSGYKKHLAKKNFKGAEILLKKLTEKLVNSDV